LYSIKQASRIGAGGFDELFIFLCLNLICFMKNCLLFLGITMSMIMGISACRQTEIPTPGNSPVKLSDAKKEELANYFSSNLSRALQAEPLLRTFLKTESIKQFDGDYDVLYQIVKNEKITAKETFREILLKYGNSDQLNFIDRNYLDLNMKVLGFELPVEAWNIHAFSPMVVVRTYDKKAPTLVAYDGEGKTHSLSSQIAPKDITIVIEESERVHIRSLNSIHEDVKAALEKQSPLISESAAEINNPVARYAPPKPRGDGDPASDNWTENHLEIRGELYTVRGSSNTFDKHMVIADVYKDYLLKYGASQNIHGYDRWLTFSNTSNSIGAFLPTWDVTLSGDKWKISFYESDPGEATRTIKKSYSSNFDFGIKLIDTVTKLPVGFDANFKGAAGAEETFTIKDVDEQLGEAEILRCDKLGEMMRYDTGRVQFRLIMN
jgi:hypothetical protein